MVIILKLGRHVSIAGGIDKAFDRAKELGCNCLQIFVKNPRGWKGRNIPEQEIKRIKKKKKDMNMVPLVVHNTYLINLANPGNQSRNKSIAGLIDDYSRAGRVQAEYLVIHPGNHKQDGLKNGIKRIINSLNKVLKNVSNDCMILLENVAGAGTSIGANFEELSYIIKGIKESSRIGICLDTCHAMAAGYDLSTLQGLNLVIKEIENYIGLNQLKVIHINDSRYKSGENKDEHAHIGEGHIGLTGFKNIINHSELSNLPFILETPHYEGKDEDIETIISLRE